MKPLHTFMYHRARGGTPGQHAAAAHQIVNHINGSGQFMRLWTAEEHFLINKAQILQVTELAWSID